jgi:hypothetical protein
MLWPCSNLRERAGLRSGAPAAPVAQAGSLPYRGLAIRQPRENSESLQPAAAPPTASRRHSRLTICATTGARSIAPPVGLRTFARRDAPRSREVCAATPATAASACVVAQAGSLPYRGLAIRETCESCESLEPTDAPPTASRRNGRLTICATVGARSIAPPVGLGTSARSDAPRSQEVCAAAPATAAAACVVAQAGSLPYRGLAIRETCESCESLEPTAAPPTASRRHSRLTICATAGARSIAPPVGLRTFARSDAPRSQEVCVATPAIAASASVAQAGSLPYRGLPIREPRENSESSDQTAALPTASRRHGRLPICATAGARSIAPPVGLRTSARSDAPRSQEVCVATPATANSGAVAQAESLLYRGLPIRETCESCESLEPTDAPPTASRRHSRLTICATAGARSIAPPVGLRTFSRSDAPRSQEVCAATPATANSAAVAQAGSLPYRGLAIRQPRENSESLQPTAAPPTTSRRHSRLAICATPGARSIAPPVGLRTFARSDAPRSQEVCAAMPATAASASVAQAGSLPSRGLAIRELVDSPSTGLTRSAMA